MPSHWIVVASLDHVRRGQAGGFVQACHGKASPLGRMRPGDSVTCYAPTTVFGGSDRLQAFVALGTVTEGVPYQVEMDGGFRPSRRGMLWRTDLAPASIRPLLDALDLTAGRANWGYAFRYGLVRISPHDAALIAQTMTAGQAVA